MIFQIKKKKQKVSLYEIHRKQIFKTLSQFEKKNVLCENKILRRKKDRIFPKDIILSLFEI